MATLKERVEKIESLTEKIGELIVLHDADLDEMRRENRQTRKIWIAIAKKQQLFDDDQWLDVFGDAA